jgi:3-deoxy-D-manno-octulosonic-acid transferase
VARIKYGAFLGGSMSRALGGLVLLEPVMSRIPLVHYRSAHIVAHDAAAAAALSAALANARRSARRMLEAQPPVFETPAAARPGTSS